jgi:methylated-DNA-[protein]-cysteine S-methyltransferase
MTFERHEYTLPITGDLLLVTRNGALVSLDFADFAERFATLVQRRFREDTNKLPITPLPATIKQALDGWSKGDKYSFAALQFDEGGTDFQRAVWAKLRTIPCGTTWSYAQLANALNNPKAVRAVARANALNPIGIITPCHRVIGSDGSLTGYAGGLARKRALLEHEGARLSLL